MKKIKIKGFQSHKSSELNLHPNVNIIVGQSSSGKTAIFRAIEWLNTNRPLGTRFISHGETQAEVTIDDVRGTKTDKGKTYYTLANDNKFDSGSVVPDLVTQALNLNSINIQNQLDEHFLITNSPGEVARTFNRILNIEKVDEYVSKLTTKINTTNTIIKEKTEQIESLTNQIKDLNYLDDLQEKFLFLDGKIKQLLNVKDSVLKLSEVIKKVKYFEITIFRDSATLNQISKILKEFDTPIQELKKYKLKNELLQKALNLESQRVSNSLTVTRLRKDIVSMGYERLIDTKANTSILQGSINQFDAILKITETKENAKKLIGINVQTSLDQYQKELEDYKICPICLTPINDVSHIIQEVRKRYL